MPPSPPLAPAPSEFHAHETVETDSDVYGTFDRPVVRDTDEQSHVVVRLWRSIGFAAVLMLLASFMLLQSYKEHENGQVLDVTRSESPQVSAGVAHKPVKNVVEPMDDMSTTLRQESESDGLSCSTVSSTSAQNSV